MIDPAAIWQEYALLVAFPVTVSVIVLIVHRMVRVAVGRWFYD